MADHTTNTPLNGPSNQISDHVFAPTNTSLLCRRSFARLSRILDRTKGESPEVLVTPGLGGWVSLGPYFFFRTSKKYDIFGCIYRLLAQFGHKNWTKDRKSVV